MSDVGSENNDYVKETYDYICRVAARTAKAEVAFILEWIDEGAIIRGIVGSSVRQLRGNASLPGLHPESRPFVVYENLEHEYWFKTHPLHVVFPYAAGLIAVSIVAPESDVPAALVILNPHPPNIRDASTAAALSELSRIAGGLLYGNSTDGMRPVKAGGTSSRGGGSDGFLETGTSPNSIAQGGEPLVSFLAKTLIRGQLLRSRKSSSYVVLRRWRKSVKDEQIAALQSLKASLSPAAIEVIAEEIASAALHLYTGMTFAAVVPIPCERRHDQCLSVVLAQRVAAILGSPFRDVLSRAERALLKPASYPYRILEDVSGHVLVVDDLASTGTHVDLAMRALRAKGASPFAIVWIGG